MAKHRTHGMACKRQIVQEYLVGPLHGLARRHDLSRTLIRISGSTSARPGPYDEDAAAAIAIQAFEARIAALERLVGKRLRTPHLISSYVGLENASTGWLG